jgi:hypothetical protein
VIVVGAVKLPKPRIPERRISLSPDAQSQFVVAWMSCLYQRDPCELKFFTCVFENHVAKLSIGVDAIPRATLTPV